MADPACFLQIAQGCVKGLTMCKLPGGVAFCIILRCVMTSGRSLGRNIDFEVADFGLQYSAVRKLLWENVGCVATACENFRGLVRNICFEPSTCSCGVAVPMGNAHFEAFARGCRYVALRGRRRLRRVVLQVFCLGKSRGQGCCVKW